MKALVLMAFLLIVTGCAEYKAAKNFIGNVQAQTGIIAYDKMCGELTYNAERKLLTAKDISSEAFRRVCKRSEIR